MLAIRFVVFYFNLELVWLDQVLDSLKESAYRWYVRRRWNGFSDIFTLRTGPDWS